MRKPFLFAALAAVAVFVCALPAGAADRINATATAAVTCATTATAADTSLTNSSGPRFYSVCAPSTNTADVFVGDSTVTAANGTPLAAGKCWTSGERSDVVPYCIVSSGTQAVRVQESL